MAVYEGWEVQDDDTFFPTMISNGFPITGENAYEKHEILSSFEIKSEMALSVLPNSMYLKYEKIKNMLHKLELDEVISAINQFQKDLNNYKKNIQAYALEIFKFSHKNMKKFDKEIISRSQNWDSTRITLMDKLI